MCKLVKSLLQDLFKFVTQHVAWRAWVVAGVCGYYMRTMLVGPLERTPELTNKFYSLCRLKYRLVDGLGIFQHAELVTLDCLTGQRGVIRFNGDTTNQSSCSISLANCNFSFSSSSSGLSLSAILRSLDYNKYLKVLFSYLDPVLINKERSRFVRCWHAETDGWAASTFHSNCDGRGPTVTIIKVNSYIFGGYTDVSWTSSE